jgi:cytochrome b
MLRGLAERYNHSSRVRVWDAPVRVAHWLVAALVIVEWLTRGAQSMDLHAVAGYIVLATCLFRFAWGFMGTRHARFASFISPPAAVIRYLRALASDAPERHLGHNPAGGWWILLLLAFEIAVTATGIVAIGGMHGLGPLAGRAGPGVAEDAMTLHRVLAWWMLAAVGVHVVAAIATSAVHRENLVVAMVTGMKTDVSDDQPPVARHRAPAIALFVALTCGAAAYLWHANAEVGPGTISESANPASWRGECESCHLAYPPCLLPGRSWDAILAPGADHFGEDLALSADLRERLSRIAATPPHDESWACWKMRTSVPQAATPVRITATPFWRDAHARLAPRAFKPPSSSGPHDCGACHRDASSSTFGSRSLQISH